ncbi:MAG: C40 family peptidase [Clostridia bacterium]|nr:C40 family peptidase [Clostridia bacterium]
MKKFFMILILVLTLTFAGCYYTINNQPDTSVNAPAPDYDTNSPEVDEEQEKKKYYAVSTTNSLRIRSGAGSSYGVVGYLDKNDAVLLIAEENGYYKTTYKEKVAYVSKAYCTVMGIETASESKEKAIDLGCELLGYPYVWGSQRYHWGNGKLNTNFKKGEFDCSALVQYIYYKSNGSILALTSRTQVNNGTEVLRNDLSRGDLMFFTNQSRQNKTGIERIGHVGIYLGNNYILHTASDHAVIEPISTQRWSYYITARRVV